MQQRISSTYQDGGTETLTLHDGTRDAAHKLINNFSLRNDLNPNEQDGYIEQYWVNGLESVAQTFEDPGKDHIVPSKVLSSYSEFTSE